MSTDELTREAQRQTALLSEALNELTVTATQRGLYHWSYRCLTTEDWEDIEGFDSIEAGLNLDLFDGFETLEHCLSNFTLWVLSQC